MDIEKDKYEATKQQIVGVPDKRWWYCSEHPGTRR